MKLRLRLLQGATALLYMGPLLAGLGGFGWAMLVPFISVFLLWLMIVRPHLWPQTNSEWLGRDAWVALLSLLFTQTLLVAVCFGIGRGIGGVLGYLPLFHPLLPVAVSLLALPISRMIWDPDLALAEGRTIDEVLYQKNAMFVAPQPVEAHDAIASQAEALVSVLMEQSESVDLATMSTQLDELLDDPAAWARLGALNDALAEAPGRYAVLREALIFWATEPETFATGSANSAIRVAFSAAERDVGLLSKLLPRAVVLASAFPERHYQFPEWSELDNLSRARLPRQAALSLAQLRAVLSQEEWATQPVNPPKGHATKLQTV